MLVSVFCSAAMEYHHITLYWHDHGLSHILIQVQLITNLQTTSYPSCLQPVCLSQRQIILTLSSKCFVAIYNSWFVALFFSFLINHLTTLISHSPSNFWPTMTDSSNNETLYFNDGDVIVTISTNRFYKVHSSTVHTASRYLDKCLVGEPVKLTAQARRENLIPWRLQLIEVAGEKYDILQHIVGQISF